MTTATTKSFPGSRSLENVSVEEAMHRGVLSCPFDTPLAEVARMMATHRIHAVVGLGDIAGDDIRVWGVVSDRDLVAMAAAGGDVAAQTAGSSAATEVLTIDRRDSLRHAAQRMHEHALSHLLVLEPGSDRPVGVLSSLDVAAALADHEQKPPPVGTSVADLMTARVVTVPPDLSLKQAAAIMVEKGISGVPVVRDGTVVGVLSEADIVAEERGTPAGGRRSLGWIVRKEGDAVATRLTALTAGDAMTAPAVTIESWRSAASAAALLTKRGVKRLPVLDNGRLVGIVTRSDLVRAFARPDEEIEREIRERVVVREFWQSPEDVAVSVDGGRVRLSGTVDDRIVADGLPDEVQRVPGVIAVDSTLASRRREPLRFRLLRS